MPDPHDFRRPFRTPWALLVFLASYVVLLIVVSRLYLIPAMKALADATDSEKKLLSAHSLLLLAVILFILGVGMVLTFRVGRFFFPLPTPRRTQTRYIDAWAEAGKRAKADEEDAE